MVSFLCTGVRNRAMPDILFLNKAPPYRHTGAERVLWNVATHLAEEGWRVHILCPEGDKPPEVENITFHHVPTLDSFFGEMASYFLSGIPAFRRVITSYDIDLIYDNASPFPFVFAYTYPNQELVTKVHAIYGVSAFQNKSNLISKVGTPLGEQLYRLLDGATMLAVSESTKDRLSGLVRCNPEEITVVPNGIDVSEFDYKFNPDGPIISLCELTPRKNISALLRAWSRLEPARKPNRELIIAGDGTRRKPLEELASDLSLTSVRFVGYVSEKRKRKLFRDAFCYVLPTRMEGTGISNIEAMASGCVVLSTDSPGVSDYLTDQENGYLVSVDDPKSLSERLEEILDNAITQEHVAEAGRKTAEQFDIKETVNREQRVLEGMLTPEPRPPDPTENGCE